MIFVPPSFFQGRRLRPCFNGVDAPDEDTRDRLIREYNYMVGLCQLLCEDYGRRVIC